MVDITQFSAPDNLEGRTINGWHVIKKHSKPIRDLGETGGNFSICYTVEKDGKEYFMKVLDYKRSLSTVIPPNSTRAQVVGQYFIEFDYEKRLSSYCNSKKATNVIMYIDSGEISFPEEFPLIPTVSYIVYEMAQGNIRNFLDFSKKLDTTAALETLADRLKMLHDIATGLNSLHSIDVSHQDLKPSNVMVFKDESKLGDLGRSLCFSQSVQCPYPFDMYLGDLNYAPPEAIFEYHISDLRERHYQTDNYMLGGLIVFCLIGMSFNALLNLHLPKPMRTLREEGLSFESARTFLMDSFQKSLHDIRNEIAISSIQNQLVQMVEYLCYPDPTKRGHPINISKSNRTANFDLHRTITELDLMAKKAKLELSKI